jgi:S1-C subfamily serine protease
MSSRLTPSQRVRRRVVCALVGTLLTGAGAARAQQAAVDPYAQAVNMQRALQELFERVEPAVVTVFPESAELELAEKIKYGLERMPQAIGSGFIIDRRGYLITNEHVVRGGQKSSVLLSNGDKYDGRVVGCDQLLDIALVKIVLPDEEKDRTFPVLRLGDSDQVRPGMYAIALGNPIGFLFDDPEPVMTIGIVSGVHRTFVYTLMADEEGIRTYGDLIQTDAAINPGNSGGPLLNLAGEVIGVNTLTALVPGEGRAIGISFAVPANTVQRKIKLMGKGCGVRRPMQYGTLEARLKTLDEFVADVLHLKGERGVLVDQVVKGGAADTAGIQDKDVIFKVNGRRVVNSAQLISIIAHLPLDEPVELELWRIVDDAPKTLTVEVTLSAKTLKEIEASLSHSSSDEDD